MGRQRPARAQYGQYYGTVHCIVLHIPDTQPKWVCRCFTAFFRGLNQCREPDSRTLEKPASEVLRASCCANPKVLGTGSRSNVFLICEVFRPLRVWSRSVRRAPAPHLDLYPCTHKLGKRTIYHDNRRCGTRSGRG